MPYVKNSDIAVRYESFGDSANRSLILIFGISMTCEDWVDLGYVSQLSKNFHMVCVEPRGHGQSTCPTDPSAYALSAMASDINAVIHALKLKSPLVWGYSLGAKIALAATYINSSTCSGLILGGFELHSQVDLENDLVAETFSCGAQAWLELWQQMFAVPSTMATRLTHADTKALYALRVAEAEWPSLHSAAKAFAGPTLLYAGENCFYREATAHAATRFPAARYLERSGRNHFDLMPDSAWIAGEVTQKFAVVI